MNYPGWNGAWPRLHGTWRHRIRLSFMRAVCRFVLFSVATTAALVLWGACGLVSVGVRGGKSVI